MQVVGEMSNRNGPWRKFAQTFFLAQQQSGYFVLNDIFRYLRNDDEVDEDKHTPEAATEKADDANGVVSPKVTSPAPAAIASPTPPAEPVEEEDEEESKVQEEKKEEPSPSAPATATTSAVQSPQPVSASPEKANPPKTWANLAAANSKKWGQLTQEKASPSNQPAAAASTATSPRATRADHAKPPTPAQQNVQSVSHALCFVKNVTEQVHGTELRAILQAKFGLIRDIDLVRAKACAFVQFDKIESAKKAIIASHSKDQGGEGGVKIGGQTVQLESRREKTKNKQQQKKNNNSNNGRQQLNQSNQNNQQNQSRNKK